MRNFLHSDKISMKSSEDINLEMISFVSKIILLADITFYVTCNQLHVDTVSQIVKLTKHNDIDDHLSPPNQQSVS